MIHPTILSTIGKTPIVALQRLVIDPHEIWVKLEWTNPGGSTKDRIAHHMIEMAEKEGSLHQNSRVIEATSGNTGIGLAMVCAVKGYPLTIVMPDNVNKERIQILQAFGVEVVLTPAFLGMKGALEKLAQIQKEDPHFFCPQQFKNPHNPAAHALFTAEEIWEQTQGKLDYLVVGMGTGGTLSGLATTLKGRIPHLQVIGVEPAESPLLTQGFIGSHRLQGIGMSAGFVPPILKQELIDQVRTASYQDAMYYVKEMAQKEGIFMGVSSGATLSVALQKAREIEKNKKRFLVMLVDSGYRYLSENE